MNELQEIKTIGDALTTGGMVALQGMAIVFSVLILLMVVLALMKVFFYKNPAKQNVKQEAVCPAPVVEEKKEEEMDDTELVAVLTAAIAASLNTSTYNLKIKSYRRVGGKTSAWSRAGLEETVNHY